MDANTETISIPKENNQEAVVANETNSSPNVDQKLENDAKAASKEEPKQINKEKDQSSNTQPTTHKPRNIQM